MDSWVKDIRIFNFVLRKYKLSGLETGFPSDGQAASRLCRNSQITYANTTTDHCIIHHSHVYNLWHQLFLSQVIEREYQKLVNMTAT